MTNQRTDQFFHGTRHDIRGGVVVPAKRAGLEVGDLTRGDTGGMSGGDFAFAVRNDEHYAWQAANTFHRSGEERERPRVYEVEPAGDLYRGPKNRAGGLDEWASRSGFNVKRQIDTMPGRQGTFPNINWNQFADVTTPPPRDRDLNHPTDADIETPLGEQAKTRMTKFHTLLLKNNAAEARTRGRELSVIQPHGPHHPTLFD